jgi:hypothetical protein
MVHVLPSSARKRLAPCRSDEVETEGTCPQNLELRWMSEVASSVYATPLITDLYSDGHKDIVVPAFVHHLEVLYIKNSKNVAKPVCYIYWRL